MSAAAHAYAAALPEAIKAALLSGARRQARVSTNTPVAILVFDSVDALTAATTRVLALVAALATAEWTDESVNGCRVALARLVRDTCPQGTLGKLVWGCSRDSVREDLSRRFGARASRSAGFCFRVGAGGDQPMVTFAQGFQACGACGVQGRLKVCTGCNDVAYCNAACSAGHWATHKPACKSAKALEEAVVNHFTKV